MLEIPRQLQNGQFILLEGKTKTPFAERQGDSWHICNSTDDQLRVWDGNLAFLCGSNNVRVIDIEGKEKGNLYFKELTKALDELHTFKVATPSGGFHYYIQNNDEHSQAYFNITINGIKCGEYRAKKCYVVAPNSTVNEKTYTVQDSNAPVQSISLQEVQKMLNVGATTAVSSIISKVSDHTKSGKEFAEVCRLQERALMSKGIELSFEEINQEMQPFVKWTTAHPQYCQHTYNRATIAVKKKMAEFNRRWGGTTPAKEIAPRLGEKEKEFSSTRFKLWKVNDFFKLRKDRRFLVEGMLYPKTVVMLYSPPAQFKSFIAEQVAVCVAKGLSFMGLKTHKYPVLVCDNENNEQTLKERLMAILAGNNIRRKTFPLHYIVRQGNLDDSEFKEELKRCVVANKIKLVIFDTLHRFSMYDENEANDLNLLYTQVFQPLVDECDCTVLFLHHTTKDGQYRGSSDFLGMVDAAFSVKRRGKDTKFDLVCEKARWGELETISGDISFEEEKIVFSRLDPALELAEAQGRVSKLKETTYEIRDLFPMVGSQMKRSDLFVHFDMKFPNQFSHATIRKSLEWLCRNEWLESNGRGTYTRIGTPETTKELGFSPKDEAFEDKNNHSPNEEVG